MSQITDAKFKAGYRYELHGLRGVAILLVMLYHVFSNRVSGGVDVFLMISAFLLTGSFTRKLERYQRLNIKDYWLKAFKRLLPPAAVTIIFTLFLGWLFYSPLSWRDLLADAQASILYYENFHLISKATDYYAANRATASPFQHFWSLSIQGQVFIIWPLIIGLLGWVIWKYQLNVRKVLLAGFSTIFVVSLTYSVWLTNTDQLAAYFGTFARLWEFALGSIIAVVIGWIEDKFSYGPAIPPEQGKYRQIRAVIGWIGFITLICLGLVVDVQGLFPGWIALIPTLAASAVIIAGRTGLPWAVDGLLASRPFQKLGDISYGLYLFHWPILVTVTVATNQERPTFLQGILIVIISLLAAWWATKFIDNPIRYSWWLSLKNTRLVTVIALSILSVLACILVPSSAMDRQANRTAKNLTAHPGARAVGTDWQQSGNRAAPPAHSVRNSIGPELDQACSERYLAGYPTTHPNEGRRCRQTSFGSDDKVIVVYGSSREEMMMNALLEPARENGYRVVSLIGWGCPIGTTWIEECSEWYAESEEYIRNLAPTAVFMHIGETEPPLGDYISDDTIRVVDDFTSRGIKVIGLRTQPRFDFDPLECEVNGTQDECSVPANDFYSINNTLLKVKDKISRPELFYPVDIAPYLCPDGICSPIYGGVYVFIDARHVTWEYAGSMAPAVNALMTEAGWVWE